MDFAKELYEDEDPGFRKEILGALLGKPSSVTLDSELRSALTNIESLEDMDEFLETSCVPMENNEVHVRKKVQINNFWRKLKPPDISDCKVKVFGNTKLYLRENNLIAVSVGKGEGGQYGEFSSPLVEKANLDALHSYFYPDWNGGTKIPVEHIENIIQNFPIDSHYVIETQNGFVEFLPLSTFGIKSVPITVNETESSELQANNGTFTSEIIANSQYELLAIKGCCFTPLFSKSTIVDFNLKLFSSEVIITVNRLQKTLRAIKRESEVLKNFPDNPVSWAIINEKNLDSSLFSNKIGLFSTTTVGKSIISPPMVERDELLAIIVDALWTIEQAISNKIYLTDMNIGNVLYYDMTAIAEYCGWSNKVPTVREYVWGEPEKTFRIRNFYTRLTFVDLGTSFIERPSYGNQKITDLSPPMTKDIRYEMRSKCREDVISVLMYCIVVNGNEPDFVNIVGNLNTNKNLFEQFITLGENLMSPKPDSNLEVSEKYVARVFR